MKYGNRRRGFIAGTEETSWQMKNSSLLSYHICSVVHAISPLESRVRDSWRNNTRSGSLMEQMSINDFASYIENVLHRKGLCNTYYLSIFLLSFKQ